MLGATGELGRDYRMSGVEEADKRLKPGQVVPGALREALVLEERWPSNEWRAMAGLVQLPLKGTGQYVAGSNLAV